MPVTLQVEPSFGKDAAHKLTIEIQDAVAAGVRQGLAGMVSELAFLLTINAEERELIAKHRQEQRRNLVMGQRLIHDGLFGGAES